MKNYIFLFCLCALFSSNTDNELIESNSSDIKLLKRIYLDSELLIEYEYFSDNKIKSKKTYSGNVLSSTKTFEYSNDTVYTQRIISSYIEKDKGYLLDSNTLINEHFLNDNLQSETRAFHSNENCRLTRYEVYNQFGGLWTYTDYNYIDSDCSYTSTRNLFDDTQRNRYNIIKDDKNSYRSSLTAWPLFIRKHNIVEYKQWDENDELLIGNSYNSTFVYDEDDYPIQETQIKLAGGLTKVFTYEYYEN